MKLFSAGNTQMRNILTLVALAWLAYATLTFLTPGNDAIVRYDLTYTQLQFLRTTFLIPYFFIWMTAVYASVRFHQYSLMLKGSPESRAYDQISLGLAYLAVNLIMPAFIGLVSAYHPGDGEALRQVTIARNYVTVLLYLAAFWMLRQGSKNLYLTVDSWEHLKSGVRRYSYYITGAIAIAYVAAIYYNEFRSHAAGAGIGSTYYLPDTLIILTIIIPYIFIWFLGTLAIINFYEYSCTVKGTVYKKAFSNTGYGLVAIITLSIVLQFLSQLTVFFGKASLSILLEVIFLLLLVMAAGYAFIARGVRALTAIEKA